MDRADSSTSSTKVPPNQNKISQPVAQNPHPLPYTINACIIQSLSHTHRLTHSCRRMLNSEKTHPNVDTPHPESPPKTHYSPLHMHKDAVSNSGQNMFIRNSTQPWSLESKAQVQILTLQLSSCMAPTSKWPGFLNCKMRKVKFE